MITYIIFAHTSRHSMVLQMGKIYVLANLLPTENFFKRWISSTLSFTVKRSPTVR